MKVFPGIAVAASMALAGCSGLDTGLLGQLAQTTVGPLVGIQGRAPAVVASDLPDAPVISISRPNNPVSATVAAVARQGDGYVVYQDRTRRSVVLHGGQVSGTMGFAFDLSAVKTQANDPVVNPTPASAWPATFARSYEFSLQSEADFQITVVCTTVRSEAETIMISDKSYMLQRMRETCTNGTRTFTNNYWVEPETGTIRRSVQWVGPRVTPMVIEVIRS